VKLPAAFSFFPVPVPLVTDDDEQEENEEDRSGGNRTELGQLLSLAHVGATRK
jgi:hypothetical protein